MATINRLTILACSILVLSTSASAQWIPLPQRFDAKSAPLEKKAATAQDAGYSEYLSVFGISNNEIRQLKDNDSLFHLVSAKEFKLSRTKLAQLQKRFPGFSPLQSLNLDLFGIWTSREYSTLVKAYQAAGVENFGFSLAAKVPVSFFLERQSQYTGINSGRVDLLVRGDYFEAQLDELCRAKGLDPETVKAALRDQLGLKAPSHRAAIPGKVALSMYEILTQPAKSKARPLAVIAVRSEASEGTFSEQRIIPELAKTHRVLALGIASDTELASKVTWISRQYGSPKLLVLAGHANPFGLMFGDSGGEEAFLDPSDQDVFSAIGTAVKGGTVVLTGCSAAAPAIEEWRFRNIAQVISQEAIGVANVIGSAASSLGTWIYYRAGDAAKPYGVFYLNSVPVEYRGRARQPLQPVFYRALRTVDSNFDWLVSRPELRDAGIEFGYAFGSLRGDRRYNQIFDLNNDGAIGSLDLNALKAVRTYYGFHLAHDFPPPVITNAAFEGKLLRADLSSAAGDGDRFLITVHKLAGGNAMTSPYDYVDGAVVLHGQITENSAFVSLPPQLFASDGGSELYQLWLSICRSPAAGTIEPFSCSEPKPLIYEYTPVVTTY